MDQRARGPNCEYLNFELHFFPNGAMSSAMAIRSHVHTSNLVELFSLSSMISMIQHDGRYKKGQAPLLDCTKINSLSRVVSILYEDIFRIHIYMRHGRLFELFLEFIFKSDSFPISSYKSFRNFGAALVDE